MLKVLHLDDAEESALAYLVQACISDKLLERSGLTSHQASVMMEAVRTLDAKLMEIAVRSGKRQVPPCGERISEALPGDQYRCTRPSGHTGGHIAEIVRD